ncbi:MAG: ATP-binding protein [Nitrospirota bacterium]
MKEKIAVSFPSHPKYLTLVRAVTVRTAQIYGIGEALAEDIKLAVDEACANVIKHAYKGDTSKKIVLKYMNSKKQFTVIIEDAGIKADPGSIQGRDLDDLKPGGLGVHFIRRVFDVFTFDDKKKKGNRLILTKYHGSEK